MEETLHKHINGFLPMELKMRLVHFIKLEDGLMDYNVLILFIAEIVFTSKGVFLLILLINTNLIHGVESKERKK